MRSILIKLGVKWLIGALKSDKEGIKEKAIDGLKQIPDEELRKGITEL